MTEELPLPPDVRATQADALKHLASPWQCDAEERTCDEPALYGGRITCCRATVLLCTRHVKLLLNDFAAARLAGYSMLCPRCGWRYDQPLRPGDMFDKSIPLTITAPDHGGQS